MTTYFPFTPTTTSVFQFQPTLDGSLYVCAVTFNLFGQRYYINLYDLSGNLVISTAMVGSPNGYDISLVGALFSSTLVYREASGTFEVNP